MKELKDLKVGDLVILNRETWCFTIEEYLAKIEKITPKGYIKVRGMLFYADGTPRGDYPYNIEVATDQKINAIKEGNFITKVLKKIRHVEDLTYEQAVEINDLLKKWEAENDS